MLTHLYSREVRPPPSLPKCCLAAALAVGTTRTERKNFFAKQHQAWPRTPIDPTPNRARWVNQHSLT